MTQLLQRFERKHMVWLVNALVFLFFITVLTFKKGYSYVPMTLAGIGIIYLFIHIFKLKKPLNLSKEDKWLIFAFVFYFGTFAFSAIYHGDGFREIDNPSRVLLFLPLLLLFREFPINIKVILHGVPIGAAIAGVIAIYQKFYLGLILPFPGIMSIQAGNIAVTLGYLSFAITLYWLIKRKYIFVLLYSLSTVLGFIASFLTGARGGWIALPVILITVLYFYRTYFNKKITIGILTLFLLAVISTLHIPNIGVKERYEAAKSDITLYLEKGEKYTSIGTRFDMWENAILGFKEKPFLGWGSIGYKELKQTQVKNGTMAESTLWYNDAHNQYLDILVKKGLLGLFSLLTIFFIPLYLMYTSKEQTPYSKLLGVISIISVMIFSLTQTFLAHNSGMILYAMLIIVFYGLSRTEEE